MERINIPVREQKFSPAAYRKWMNENPRQADVYLDMVNQGRHAEARDLRDTWVWDWMNPVETSGLSKPKNELRDAIEYFVAQGFIEELTTDKAHYVKVLCEHASKALNIEIDWNS